MAIVEHLDILKRGVEHWNNWRRQNSKLRPDLSGAYLPNMDLPYVNFTDANLIQANLAGADLRGASFSKARVSAIDLSDAVLREANLFGADLSKAKLEKADLTGSKLFKANLYRARLDEGNLSEAKLFETNLSFARLRRVNLYRADLRETNLTGADLTGANFQYSRFRGVILAKTILSDAVNLDQCKHRGPNIIDMRTLRESWPLPLRFLRGCGLDDLFIEYLPSLLSQPIQYYSCFISYSSKDQKFAERLNADLQDRGVRCWFAPEDMKIGEDIWDTIDEAIRLRDKVLLILSINSIGSSWVEDEVKKGFAEERSKKEKVLFPIRIDDAVMESGAPWATKIRNNRNIGDFSSWKDHDAYQRALKRLLRDLKTNVNVTE